jgi:hypothetical protein
MVLALTVLLATNVLSRQGLDYMQIHILEKEQHMARPLIFHHHGLMSSCS